MYDEKAFGHKIDDKLVTGKEFNVNGCRICCLAHVINLATQALMKTHTKSKYYNPASPEEYVPSTMGRDRDKVGLIRAISVKKRSLAQWKQLFKDIQIREGVERPLQDINTFIYEMGLKELNLDRGKKIGKLELHHAQQAFSSNRNPSLHLAIPALEALHKAWSARLARLKYGHFKKLLQAAIDKIAAYYKKTGGADAYIIAMLLDPNEKMNHFKKYWDEGLQHKARENAEHIFQDYYVRIHGDVEHHAPITKGRGSGTKVTRLLWELSDDDMEDDDDDISAPSINPWKPWLQAFNYYMNTFDQLAKNQSIVQWWGLNATRYGLVWTAHNFLGIMASSVSSEDDELLDECTENSGEDNMDMFTYFTISSLGFSPSPDQAHCQGWAQLSEWDPCQNLEFLPKCVPGPAQGLQLDLFCKGNGKVKVTFLLVLVVFFVKILHITPIQDIHVHISACQANWGFEANATDLSSKAQALPIWLSDIIDINGHSWSVVIVIVIGIFKHLLAGSLNQLLPSKALGRAVNCNDGVLSEVLRDSRQAIQGLVQQSLNLKISLGRGHQNTPGFKELVMFCSVQYTCIYKMPSVPPTLTVLAQKVKLKGINMLKYIIESHLPRNWIGPIVHSSILLSSQLVNKIRILELCLFLPEFG
ncbi:hypothetical protein P692DRAFT_201808334 [Suillus brevipes Sb2]|nr:hypothetical protein P692DRAFT_201808334 [Suillus brevipes Sb2]